MVFDFKKEYKEFYMPASKPSIVTIPPMNYIAVRGEGNPNAEDGAYNYNLQGITAGQHPGAVVFQAPAGCCQQNEQRTR